MKGLSAQGLTLDTGALLALDNPAKTRAIQSLLRDTHNRGWRISIPVEVVAQSWRSPRQVRLARLLKSPDTEVVEMTLNTARSVGLICAETGHADVVDVHVVLCARERGHAVMTSNPRDLSRVDPALRLLVI